MARAEGRSLLAVAATNLFQVVAAWKNGERLKDLFGRWTRIERGLVCARGDCLHLPGGIHGETARIKWMFFEYNHVSFKYTWLEIEGVLLSPWQRKV